MWPAGADGDVFRRLAQAGFDFDRTYAIDFNIDFEAWPPPPALVVHLRRNYPQLEGVEPDGDSPGYLHVVVRDKLTYQLVTFIQTAISELVRPYGGVCESWGVLHESRR